MNPGMTRNSQSIRISLSGLFPDVTMRRKNISANLPTILYKYKYMTNHWFGNSRIRPIDVDELFNIKFIINELEYS